MDEIRAAFYVMPPLAQIVFAMVIAVAIQTIILYLLAALGLKQAKELIAYLMGDKTYEA